MRRHTAHGWRLAPLPAASALLLAASCGGGGSALQATGTRGGGPTVQQLQLVEPGAESRYDSLRGVEGLSAASPATRAEVVARANRTRCDCGCPGHTVAECLQQEERCEVAVRLAGLFMEDALAVERHGLTGADTVPAPAPEKPETDHDAPEEPDDAATSSGPQESES